MTEAIAFLNYGRWLIECPGCGAPSTLRPGDVEYEHLYYDEDEDESWGCGAKAAIVWPDNLSEINAAFDVRTRTVEIWDYDEADNYVRTGRASEEYGGAYDGRDHFRSWNPGQPVPEVAT